MKNYLIKIIAIPEESIIEKKQYMLLYKSMLRNIAVLSDNKISTEIVFSSNNNSNCIECYLVIRNSESENLSETICSSLKSYGYIGEVINFNELGDRLNKLVKNDNIVLSSVDKEEKAITSNVSFNGFYYYVDQFIHKETVDNFDSLFESLLNNKDAFVSFQLLPTQYVQQEEHAIREMNNTLLSLTSGIYQQGQMIKEEYANDVSQCYKHYVKNIGQPLFLFNILICAPMDAVSSLSSAVISLLQSSTENIVNLNTVDLTKHKNVLNDYSRLPWNLSGILQQYYRNQAIWNNNAAPINLARLPFLITLDEAVTFFRLPYDNGRIKGMASNNYIDTNELIDGKISNEDSIILGKIKNDNSIYGIDINKFTQHALVVGMSGTGKTTFMLNLVIQFHEKGIPFLIIEPTKTEYRALIDKIPDIQIFTPGNNEVSPFIINPFIPPEGVKLELYTPSLVGAFKAAFSMPGPLEEIFLKVINRCYYKFGWRKNSVLGDKGCTVFGLHEYIREFKDTIKTMKYKGDFKSNLETAGVLRLMNLIEQNSSIYDNINTIPIHELISKPTLIELNAIDNEEYKSLLMALLLINVCVYTKNVQKNNESLKNLLLIDEAHVLLEVKKNGNDESQKDSMAAVRRIHNMIKEVRAYGTGIIISDQSATKVGNDVIGNTNVKIAFRTVEKDSRDIVVASSNMNEDMEKHLTMLNKGEAFVANDDLNYPKLLVTPNVRKEKNIRNNVSNNELKEKNIYWLGKENILIPFKECKYSKACKKCNISIKYDADYYANRVYIEYSDKIRDIQTFKLCLDIISRLISHSISMSGTQLKQLRNCALIAFYRKVYLEKDLDIDKKTMINALRQNLNKLD